MKNSLSTAWSDMERSRHFLVPDDTQLPSGKFAVRSILGRRLEVDEAALQPYAVSKEEANAVVREQLGGVFRDAKERLGALMEQKREERQAAAAERKKARAERGPRPFSAEAISEGFQQILSDLPRDQKHKLEGLAPLLKASMNELGAMFDGALSLDDEKMQAARSRLDKLKQELQAKGSPRREPADQGLDQSATASAPPKSEIDDPVARAQYLEKLADQVEDLGRIYARRLREKARTFRAGGICPNPEASTGERDSATNG